ncbi:MAG: phenylalanine--tRNA ligase subunit beta [Spirochaetia bacterium]
MKVILSWLEEFVDLCGIPLDDIVNRLRQSTAEVEEVYTLFAPLDNVVTARILSTKIIDGSDHLQLCQVDTGTTQYEVVCGAPNAKEGAIVAYAPVGVQLANGINIEKRSIMKIQSVGMLLSEKEMDLGENHQGILELPSETPIGMPILQVLGLKKETVLDIDNNSITNRPDLWGMYGFARECAAIFDRPFKSLHSQTCTAQIHAMFGTQPPPISVKVDTPHCLAYAGLCVDGVSLSLKSPWQIATRLHAVGMRSINLLVDISNYVMLELGLPNHFFDRQCLQGDAIEVKEATHPQPFITLDGQNRKIQTGDILVCDKNSPTVIAGVMGGDSSALRTETTQIFIEGAVWEAGAVRQTASRLGMRTEASIRYEKSLDPCLVETMLLRCAQLINAHAPDAQFLSTIIHAKIFQPQKTSIHLDMKRISSLLSMTLTSEECVRILEALGFHTKTSKTLLEVWPPSWRTSKGALIDADIIEEIGRIAGYDRIKSTPPTWPLLPKELPPHVILKRMVQDFLILHGRALEIMTHPLVGQKLLDSVQWPQLNESLVLVQALSPDRDRFRPSLIPSFLEALELNQKHYDAFSFFEYGKIAWELENERYHTGYLSFCEGHSQFLDVADVLEGLMSRLGISYTLSKEIAQENPLLPSEWSGAHPFEALHIVHENQAIGFVISLHPLLLKQKKIKGHASLFVVDLTPWAMGLPEKNICIIPALRYQESVLDFTILAPKSTPAGDILAVLPVPNEGYHLQSLKILRIFEQQDEIKAVTLRARLNDKTRTLTSEDLKKSEDYIISSLAKHGWNLKQ